MSYYYTRMSKQYTKGMKYNNKNYRGNNRGNNYGNNYGNNRDTERESPQIRFNKLVDKFYNNKPYIKDVNENHELEVKFSTKSTTPLTKIDYDNVIRKLKSFGFTTANAQGGYMLRMFYEHLDKSGEFRESSIRTEVAGFRAIQDYCKTNDIDKILTNSEYMQSVLFIKKNNLYENDVKVKDVLFKDFNFSVSYKTEKTISSSDIIVRGITKEWNQIKKSFRYINRVTFTHDDYPVNVDISIVKSSILEDNSYDMKKTYTTDEAGVFNNTEVYEIELEIDNERIGPGTLYNSAESILVSLRKTIKFVLMGLQGTNYPISIYEQKDAINGYMKLLYGERYNTSKPIYPKHFTGPSSVSLQLENIIPIDDNLKIPNIRNQYIVTEKADGLRVLLYISQNGKLYLIDMNMKVIFTGAVTKEESLFNSLFDGELILHNKLGNFVNLFAIFDVYYIAKEDTRGNPFMKQQGDDEKKHSRYEIIKTAIKVLKPVSIMEGQNSPIRIEYKKFYPEVVSPDPSDIAIFEACKNILMRKENGLFEYETDGLIFTPAFMGVGGDAPGRVGGLEKAAWEYSMKWKPPEFNTIDFLVVTKKVNNDDIITPIFQDGVSYNDLPQYKTIELRSGFSQKKHGYMNPCQDVYDDKLPEYGNKQDINNYKPVVFKGVEPYDPEAGICNIMLRSDDTGTMQMFSEDGEVFSDNTIVEFKYDLDRENKWRWIPIHVRNDKTTELKQGISLNFGNAYHVAQNNWKSIHNPVTKDMITSGRNIPGFQPDEDVYYNRMVSSSKTTGLREFHNYVKRVLIQSVSNKGDTLIDYACGKGGDLPKWIHANLSFVFGIDKSNDNLEHKLTGACARYLTKRKTTYHMPYALFVNGDSSKNIRNGSAMENDKAIQVTKAVFGEGARDEEKLGRGVTRQFGKGADGFNISSCQFALHYFFKNLNTLQNFVRNLAECTKLGGYFISTSYDGKIVFDMLKNKNVDEGYTIKDDGTKIWEIQKDYISETFEPDSSSLHYKIKVFQESINQLIPEYLVNYEYFDRVMEDYGFQLITHAEANEMGLPEGSGLFSDLYASLESSAKNNSMKANELRKALNMNSYEKKISFLNRYVVYKKIRIVNTAKVILEEVASKETQIQSLDESSQNTENTPKKRATKQSIKPRARKLSKKIIIREDTDTTSPEEVSDNKLLLTQDDSDTE